jgi:hypothetical protein
MTSAARVEGYTLEELESLDRAVWDALLLIGEPQIVRFGSASVLGRIKVCGSTLVVELAQIDGGGEGVLVALWSLIARLAARWGLVEVEWLVHAVACARPNHRLRALLVQRRFSLTEHPEVGLVYRLCRPVAAPATAARVGSSDVPDRRMR